MPTPERARGTQLRAVRQSSSRRSDRVPEADAADLDGHAQQLPGRGDLRAEDFANVGMNRDVIVDHDDAIAADSGRWGRWLHEMESRRQAVG